MANVTTFNEKLLAERNNVDIAKGIEPGIEKNKEVDKIVYMKKQKQK